MPIPNLEYVVSVSRDFLETQRVPGLPLSDESSRVDQVVKFDAKGYLESVTYRPVQEPSK
jgi:hypothetical protein